MPPNGHSVFHSLCAMDERVLNKCPSTIETRPGLLLHGQMGLRIKVPTPIDDQHFGCPPPTDHGTMSLYVFEQGIKVILIQCYSSPIMDSCA